jgi:ribosomal protein S18 acetylase RimI-like enzyme
MLRNSGLSGISIQEEDSASPDAASLLDELSAELEALTGSTGIGSFSFSDLDRPRAVFAIARDESGNAVGCGAIRPMDESTAEVKRIYAREKGRGIGSLIMAFLERRAEELGYTALKLETRMLNTRAVIFYLSKGYTKIPNFGRYAGREDAVCFGKRM